MTKNVYKLWAAGNPLGIGVTGALNVGIAGVAKKATTHYPNTVINELICNRLAQMLLLPCPPGALTEFNGERYFFSLNFNLSGMSQPPIIPSDVVASQTTLCWRIILFDVLVMNADRHAGNIAHDTTTNDIQVFDHSHAFSCANGDVKANLTARLPLLSIDRHCLAQEISSGDGFSEGVSMIQSIPNYFIRGIVAEAADAGLDNAHIQTCVDSLTQRRDGVDKLVKSNLGFFPKLSAGNL